VLCTLPFGIVFERLGVNFVKSQDRTDSAAQWVYFVFNCYFTSLRIVFTGYGMLQLLPYLVNAEAKPPVLDVTDLRKEESRVGGQQD
jgi:hypothetical protein